MASVARVFLGDKEIWTTDAAKIPVTKRVSEPLPKVNSCLIIEDSNGKRFVHDLSTAVSDGWEWIHFSFEITSSFAFMSDCLLAKNSKPPVEEFQRGVVDGIRFQPILLPERTDEVPDLIGEGLYNRGFHVSGIATPAHITLSCICDHCRKSFRIHSIHAGFASLTYMYCDQFGHTMVASKDFPDAPPIFGPADEESVLRFEARLPACIECGGSFKYYNPYRCPHCAEPYIDFAKRPELRQIEPYFNYPYDGQIQRFELPANASPDAR